MNRLKPSVREHPGSASVKITQNETVNTKVFLYFEPRLKVKISLLLQLNADCLDDLPLDYDLALGGMGGVGVGGVGGVGVLALEAVVSGASSDGTLSEGGSSVVLDPGVRRVGLPQDYQDLDPLRDSPLTATTDTHTGGLWSKNKSQTGFLDF